MAQPRRLWQHGKMRDAKPGDNIRNLWSEGEIRRRTRGESPSARRERLRAERAAARRAGRR